MVKQFLTSDCGPACLTYVARMYGVRIPLARVRRLAGTTHAGTTVLGLVEAARELRFSAKGLRVPMGELAGTPLPAIAHLTVAHERNHFVVVLKVKDDRILLFDPLPAKKRWMKVEDLATAFTGVLVVIAPEPGLEANERAPGPGSVSMRLLGRNKRILFQLLWCAGLLSVLSISAAIYVRLLADAVIPDSNYRLLHGLGAALAAISLLRAGFQALQNILTLRLTQQIDIDLILGYYRHVLHLPGAFFASVRVGDITSRITDALQIRTFLSTAVTALVISPLVIVVCIGAMFYVAPPLAWIVVLQLPLWLLLYFYLARIAGVHFSYSRERFAELSSTITEQLQTIHTIKALGLEAQCETRIETKFVRFLRSIWTLGVRQASVSTTAVLLSQGSVAAILWYGAYLVLGAKVTFGELMSGLTLASIVTSAMTVLVSVGADLQRVIISANRLAEMMDEPLEGNAGIVQVTPELCREIVVRDIGVKYSGRLPVLQHVSMVMRSGEVVVFTGESGAGKSSLLAILQRSHARMGGTIEFGGVDFDYLELGSLRRALAVVPQRTELLSGSILDNIAPQEAVPDLRRIQSICAELNILSFIQSLPQKFSTPLGEGAANLSGGQRQRIALARAFYSNAPILLLDEPTVALDRDGTLRVVELVKRAAREGRLVVVSTHSRPIVEIATRVYIFKQGAITAIPAEPINLPESLPPTIAAAST